MTVKKVPILKAIYYYVSTKIFSFLENCTPEHCSRLHTREFSNTLYQFTAF